jgi:hypothetical protein
VNLTGGLIAGAIAGLFATWVLDRYQEGALSATRRAEQSSTAGSTFSRRQAEHIQSYHRVHRNAAQSLARLVGKRLDSKQEQMAGLSMHYAVGTLAGAVYGAASEWVPMVRSGYGTGFSSLLFLGGPEPLLPWLDRGRAQGKVAPDMKVSGLSSQLVFGAVLETTRRLLRRMI